MHSHAIASEKARIGTRFDRWILERVRQRRGPTDLPLTLEYRHIYVMPTRFGFWFGVLLGLTLLAYRNLVGITVTAVLSKPVFAGESASFRILLRNGEDRIRFAVQAIAPESVDCMDIEPQMTQQLKLQQLAPKRGWMVMQPFRIENRFPLGLFRAWSVIIPSARCLVYPKPAPNPPPLPNTGRGDFGAENKGEGEHVHGLREYQQGDPLRRIAWRASARHQKLYSREMESPSEEACELNWYLMGGGNTEEKLSVLTAWILKAERSQIPYSLELPATALPADLGEDHQKACLEILALFKS
jgi:uncharacterized protein (DUF58 family)